MKQQRQHLRVNDKRKYYRTVYLKSEHWANLKARVLSARPFCQQCGCTENLDVHHLNYRNLYDVTPADVIVLCRKHHEAAHQKLESEKRVERQRRKNRSALNRKRNAEFRKQRWIAGVYRMKPKRFAWAVPRMEMPF